MLLHAPHQPLSLEEIPRPIPDNGQVLISVEACAVCRTDLHLIDDELDPVPYPIIPGHQVVGRILESEAENLPVGTRVGVPWLGYTCGSCTFCAGGHENLCETAGFTGYTLPGGYAEYLTADSRYCFPLTESRAATAMAPLLCAGLIGYRALRMCGDAQHVGLYGFGAAAHILAQVLAFQGREFYAFTRPGDETAVASARELGAAWAGSSEEPSPRELDAAIIFAPVGTLVPASLKVIRKGGVVVCGGIHMSAIPEFAYELLWGERQLRSVANLTRTDGMEFLALAERIPVETKTEVFELASANEALEKLRSGDITGSAVLSVRPS